MRLTTDPISCSQGQLLPSRLWLATPVIQLKSKTHTTAVNSTHLDPAHQANNKQWAYGIISHYTGHSSRGQACSMDKIGAPGGSGYGSCYSVLKRCPFAHTTRVLGIRRVADPLQSAFCVREYRPTCKQCPRRVHKEQHLGDGPIPSLL